MVSEPVRGLFVTGTDTDCGKTLVAAAIIRRLREPGLRVAGFKPVAAGADATVTGLRNADALALCAASGLDLPYDLVNPYCFEPPIAPHIAAAEVGVVIEPARLLSAFETLAGRCDLVVVEGAGGWLVPLAPGLDMQRLALLLELPVVLVVGLRLGCLNHALLSEQVILASGARLLGWIGSQVDPAMQRVQANLETLYSRMASPCLGVIPHGCESPVQERLLSPLVDALRREGMPGTRVGDDGI
jgi:dethiobiotin synthetase